MAGVGEQRDRMADEAEENFERDKAGVESDADGESFAEARRRVAVDAVVVIMARMTVIGVMIVVVGHRSPFLLRRGG